MGRGIIFKDKCIELHIKNPKATNRDIAGMLGPHVQPQYVSATLIRNGFKPFHGPRQFMLPRVRSEIVGKLQAAAERRGLTPSELILALVTVIANEGMADAILDDADELLETAA